jgi:hypothetical protein
LTSVHASHTLVWQLFLGGTMLCHIYLEICLPSGSLSTNHPLTVLWHGQFTNQQDVLERAR